VRGLFQIGIARTIAPPAWLMRNASSGLRLRPAICGVQVSQEFSWSFIAIATRRVIVDRWRSALNRSPMSGEIDASANDFGAALLEQRCPAKSDGVLHRCCHLRPYQGEA
jgi:hypothetical protein